MNQTSHTQYVGAEVVLGDISDLELVKRACEGVHTVISTVGEAVNPEVLILLESILVCQSDSFFCLPVTL